MELDNILVNVLVFTANALSMILFWWFKKIEREVETIKEELNTVRLNYLSRFDEIKNLLNKGHLQIIERISRLEVLVDNNYKYKRNNDDE